MGTYVHTLLCDASGRCQKSIPFICIRKYVILYICMYIHNKQTHKCKTVKIRDKITLCTYVSTVPYYIIDNKILLDY